MHLTITKENLGAAKKLVSVHEPCEILICDGKGKGLFNYYSPAVRDVTLDKAKHWVTRMVEILSKGLPEPGQKGE